MQPERLSPPEPELPNPLTLEQLIDRLDQGSLRPDLVETIAEVVLAVEETGKKGKVMLTIEIVQKNDALLMVPDITKKVPRRDSFVTILHADREGRVYSDPPQQMTMFAVQPTRHD